MASLFGDDCVEDLLNGNLNEDQELPSDDSELDQNKGNADNFFAEDAADGEPNTENAAVKVEPKKRSVRNPRPRLTVEMLRGPRGIHTIEEYFKDIKFKGKKHERTDLDEVMRRLQHWAHRMYPMYKFDDVLTTIERLGKKKPLQVHMTRYRLGMLEQLKEGTDGNVHDDNEELPNNDVADEPFDEFDALLGEQIAISKLVPRTPAQSIRYDAGAAHTSMSNSTYVGTPSFTREDAVMSTPYTDLHILDDISDLAQPLPPSQPSTQRQLDAAQLARIAENRRVAQERLKAMRMQQQQLANEEQL